MLVVSVDHAHADIAAERHRAQLTREAHLAVAFEHGFVHAPDAALHDGVVDPPACRRTRRRRAPEVAVQQRRRIELVDAVAGEQVRGQVAGDDGRVELLAAEEVLAAIRRTRTPNCNDLRLSPSNSRVKSRRTAVSLSSRSSGPSHCPGNQSGAYWMVGSAGSELVIRRRRAVRRHVEGHRGGIDLGTECRPAIVARGLGVARGRRSWSTRPEVDLHWRRRRTGPCLRCIAR